MTRKGASHWIQGGGEMGERIRRFSWDKTSLGSLECWPESLRAVVNLMINSRYPMFVWWGGDLVNLYNDAYIPVLGKRHPDGLGRPARELWSEIWPVVGRDCDTVLREGRATWNNEVLLVMERNNFTEETYFTWSYSPVIDESGKVNGVFCACQEDTARVLSGRRLKSLRDLGDRTLERSQSAGEACRAAVHVLAENQHDIPFAAVYFLSEDAQHAILCEAAGLKPGAPSAPLEIRLGHSSDLWNFSAALADRKLQIIPDLPDRFGKLPTPPWPDDHVQQGIVVPLAKSGVQEVPAGFLVAGLSPRLTFDDEYRGFLELAAGHIATGIAHARAYEEERKRAEALSELDRAKTAFFSNVSHEFRTPLTLMLGPLEDLLKQATSAAHSEQLSLIHRNGLRLLKLVNSLLDFARIEANRMEAAYEPTDLAALTTDLASVFRSALEKAGLRFIVDCPPLPEPVFVDRQMWEKIVLNLLSNAFKFTSEGEIRLSLRASKTQVTLSVGDTGIGIAPDQQPHIFERFHRIPHVQSRTNEGSGIGLALVRELARFHGGDVSVESVPGQGSTFTLSIPAGSAHLPPERLRPPRPLGLSNERTTAFADEALRWIPESTRATKPAEADSATTVQNKPSDLPPKSPATILFADDNADMRQYVQRILLQGGYNVVLASDGQTALELAQESSPALVLADVMMPRLDGFELLRNLRQNPVTRALPVILLSARAGEESRVEGFQRGADGYLVKPFSARELLARVESIIKLAHLSREAEHAIHQSEQRFRRIFESTRISIWEEDFTEVKAELDALLSCGITDFHRHFAEHPELVDALINKVRVHDVNPATVALFGARNKRDLLQSLHRIFTPETRTVFIEELTAMAEGRRFLEAETSLRKLSGERLDALFTIIFPEPGDSFDRVLVTITDITERRRTEEALRTSEARYRAVLECQSELICRFKPDGTVLFVNHAYAQAGGTTVEALTGGNFWQFIPEAEHQAIRSMLDSLTPQAPQVRVENQFRTPDGLRWTLWTNRALKFNEGGLWTEAQATGIDITDRKRAEHALRESEARFRNMADHSPLMLWVTDTNGHCTYLNQRWYEFTGQTQEEGLGLGWLQAVHPEDRPHAEKAFLASTANHAPFQVEYRLHRQDGQYRWAVDAAAPRFSPTGEFLGYVGSVIDIDDQKRAEEKLEALVAQRTLELRGLNEQMEAFIYSIAHDLRAPLRSVNGFAAILVEDYSNHLDQTARSMLERMQTSVRTMDALLLDLLAYGRAARSEIDLLPVSSEEAWKAALFQCAAEIEKAGAQIISTPPFPVVLAHAATLGQMLANLLSNSLKFVAPHVRPRIQFSAEEKSDHFILWVQDNGIGIAPDQHERVFRIFERLEGARYPGTGIGLSIVRKGAERMGGAAGLESEPGHGTRFWIRLKKA